MERLSQSRCYLPAPSEPAETAKWEGRRVKTQSQKTFNRQTSELERCSHGNQVTGSCSTSVSLCSSPGTC